jgi:hypothetical protein
MIGQDYRKYWRLFALAMFWWSGSWKLEAGSWIG